MRPQVAFCSLQKRVFLSRDTGVEMRACWVLAYAPSALASQVLIPCVHVLAFSFHTPTLKLFARLKFLAPLSSAKGSGSGYCVSPSGFPGLVHLQTRVGRGHVLKGSRAPARSTLVRRRPVLPRPRISEQRPAGPGARPWRAGVAGSGSPGASPSLGAPGAADGGGPLRGQGTPCRGSSLTSVGSRSRRPAAASGALSAVLAARGHRCARLSAHRPPRPLAALRVPAVPAHGRVPGR